MISHDIGTSLSPIPDNEVSALNLFNATQILQYYYKISKLKTVNIINLYNMY